VKGQRTYDNRWLGWLILSFFIVHLSSSLAQPRLRTPEYYLGVHGGVTASSVNFYPTVSNMTPITKGCVLGGNGGVVFRYAGHKYCALQVELNYLHRGWAEHNDTIGHYSRSLHYIEIPFMMHLHFGSTKCRWFLNLGPQIGYCIVDKGNRGTLVNGAGQTQYGDISHPFDWGVAAGTGILFPTPHAGTYHVEVRFDYSFGGIFDTNPTDHFRTASPMDLSLNLGWLFPVRKKIKSLGRFLN